MWSERLSRWIQGVLYIQLAGFGLEGMLNRLVEEGIPLWQVQRKSEGTFQFWMRCKDFPHIHRLRRGSNIKVRIIKKRGLPFQLRSLRRRNGIMLGAIFFLLIVYMLSQLVWKIEVEGNERIATSQILQTAEALGIQRGKWLRSVDDIKAMESQLRQALPDVSWVGYAIEGTTVRITVIEKVLPELPTTQPQHLVATKKARVHRLITTRGRALVGINSWVEPGDLLISGYLAPSELEEKGLEGEGEAGAGTWIAAEGVVIGEVWYELSAEVPLIHQLHTFTGEKKGANYLLLGKYQLGIPGDGESPFSMYEYKERVHYWTLFGWETPLGRKVEEYWETETIQLERSLEEAIALGRGQVLAELRREIGEQGEIMDEKILQQRIEDGKVTLKFLYVVLESIAKPKPVIP